MKSSAYKRVPVLCGREEKGRLILIPIERVLDEIQGFLKPRPGKPSMFEEHSRKNGNANGSGKGSGGKCSSRGHVRRYVLDANALISLFENRPGSANPRSPRFGEQAARLELPVFLSAVNWGEFFTSRGGITARRELAKRRRSCSNCRSRSSRPTSNVPPAPLPSSRNTTAVTPTPSPRNWPWSAGASGDGRSGILEAGKTMSVRTARYE